MITADAVIKSTTHVIQPVVSESIFNLLKQLNIRDVFDDDIFINYPNSAKSTTEDVDGNIEVIRNRLDCNIDMSFDPTSVKWKAAGFGHIPALRSSVSNAVTAKPIFYDEKHNIALFEDSQPFMVKVDITATFTDKEDAYSFPTILRMYHTGKGSVYFADTVFDYSAPLEVLGLLKALHGYSDTDQDFVKWLSKNCGRLSYRMNPNNKKLEFVINKVQTRSIASIEYSETKPEVIKSGELIRAYACTFTMYIQFDRPSALKLRYPIIINNELVKEIPSKTIDHYVRLVDEYRQAHLYYLHEEYRNNFMPQLVTPAYDMWSEPLFIDRLGYSVFAKIAFTFDPDPETGELQDLKLDLKEPISDGFQLAPEVQKFISDHRNGCTGFKKHFDLSVFCDDLPFSSDSFSIDDDLVLTISCKYAKTGTHRIVFSEQVKNVDREILDYIALPENRDLIIGSPNTQLGVAHGRSKYCRIIRSEFIARRQNNR